MLSPETFEAVKAQMIRFAQTSAEMRDAFRHFFDELLAALYRDPVLLRVYGKRQPKKARRGIGRRIRRLERAQTV